MSQYPVRAGTAADMPAIARQDGVQFGYEFGGAALDSVLRVLDPDRFLVAVDGDRVVGATGEYDLNFTAPGGALLDLPAVTWVSVAPSHTRRGILRSLMHTQLRRYADEGALGTMLTASQSGIYGRFGFGAATQVRRISIDVARARLRDEVDATGVRIATADEARAAMPPVHERWRRQIPAGIGRSEPRWDAFVADLGATGQPLMYLLHADGFIAFRPEGRWADGHSVTKATVLLYAAATAEAHAALWQAMLSMELYTEISSEQLPIDDPLEHLLAEPRRVRTTGVWDGGWLRPLDIAGLLAARTYGVEFEAVWDVRDELFGHGRYRIKAGPEGAVVARTDDAPDVVSDVSVLGALYFGGHRLHALVAGGRARVDDPALLRRLDRALLADRAPFCGLHF